jgi:lysophospholipase L1-like esterase
MKIQEIIVYGDSTSMPQPLESVEMADTWYWKLAMLSKLEICLENRSQGGITASDVRKKIFNDSPYFFPKENLSNNQKLIIINIGVVDAAKHPITYKLKMVNRIPVFGKYLWFVLAKVLNPSRALVQKIWSFSHTSPSSFVSELEKIISFLTKRGLNICVLSTPIPHSNLDLRSPGFRENVVKYNLLKSKILDKFPKVFLVNLDEFNDSYYVSEKDGHHYSKSGHEYIYSRVKQEIKIES